MKKAAPPIRVNSYRVLNDCVDAGTRAGMRHFFKHRPLPKGFEKIEAALIEQVSDDVMQAITEYFDFPGPGTD